LLQVAEWVKSLILLKRRKKSWYHTYVTNCAKMGYDKTRQDVMKVVEGYMKSKGHKMSTGLSNG